MTKRKNKIQTLDLNKIENKRKCYDCRKYVPYAEIGFGKAPNGKQVSFCSDCAIANLYKRFLESLK